MEPEIIHMEDEDDDGKSEPELFEDEMNSEEGFDKDEDEEENNEEATEEQQDDNEEDEDDRTPVLINQGAYGCLYHPGFDENNKTLPENKITKLQKKNMSSENEFRISQNIKSTIPNYENYFVILEKKEPVNLASIDPDLLTGCKVVQKASKGGYTIKQPVTKESDEEYANYMQSDDDEEEEDQEEEEEEEDEFELFTMNYVDSIDLPNGFIAEKNLGMTIANIQNTYTSLLSGIDKLQKINIVHFDLKWPNILFDRNRRRPLIIDFGLSFDSETIVDHLKNLEEDDEEEIKETLINSFVAFAPDYYIWTPEANIVQFIIYDLDFPSVLDELLLQRIQTECIDSIIEQNKWFHVIYPREVDRQRLRNILIKHLKETSQKYNGNVLQMFAHEYLTEECLMTWDLYSLGVITWKAYESIVFQANGSLKPGSKLYSPSAHPFIENVFSILRSNAAPLCRNRMSVAEIKETYNQSLFYKEVF